MPRRRHPQTVNNMARWRWKDGALTCSRASLRLCQAPPAVVQAESLRTPQRETLLACVSWGATICAPLTHFLVLPARTRLPRAWSDTSQRRRGWLSEVSPTGKRGRPFYSRPGPCHEMECSNKLERVRFWPLERTPFVDKTWHDPGKRESLSASAELLKSFSSSPIKAYRPSTCGLEEISSR